MEQNLTQKVQNLRCLIRLGGGGLTPNETLSHSNGKFVIDHGPNSNSYCDQASVIPNHIYESGSSILGEFNFQTSIHFQSMSIKESQFQ